MKKIVISSENKKAIAILEYLTKIRRDAETKLQKRLADRIEQLKAKNGNQN